jgi:hypothetical protein
VETKSLALAKAGEAMQRPSCRYPDDFSMDKGGPRLNHLEYLRPLAFAAASRALLLAAAGNSNGCANDICLILGLAATLKSEPGAMSQLMRIAIVGIAEQTLERALNWISLDESMLQRLSTGFADSLNPNSLEFMFVGERVRMTRLYIMEGIDSRIHALRLSGVFEQYLPFYFDVMETNFTLAAAGPPMSLKMEKASDEFFDQYTNGQTWKTLGLYGLGHLANRDAEVKANARLALTALAVEQYRLSQRKVPQKLVELTPQFLREVPADPYDGAPLRYRALTNGYVIYSVGSDGRDDGGKEKPQPPFVWEIYTNSDFGDGEYVERYVRRMPTSEMPASNSYTRRFSLRSSSKSAPINSGDSSFDITFRVER